MKTKIPDNKYCSDIASAYSDEIENEAKLNEVKRKRNPNRRCMNKYENKTGIAYKSKDKKESRTTEPVLSNK